MRIDRLLSNSGYGSRTTIKKKIKGKELEIGGKVVTDPGFILDENNLPDIRLSGELISVKSKIHFMMNKPQGVITAMEDKRYRTVSEFFPGNILLTGIFPVGRLDIDTTGLLLFTNDGVLCHRITSPKWNIVKKYYFSLSGKYLDENDVEALKEGIVFRDGTKCKSAGLEILTSSSGILSITEGKYHQVKNMMKVLGGEVVILKRLSVGPIKLDENLREGEIRPLLAAEIKAIYESVELF